MSDVEDNVNNESMEADLDASFYEPSALDMSVNFEEEEVPGSGRKWHPMLTGVGW